MNCFKDSVSWEKQMMTHGEKCNKFVTFTEEFCLKHKNETPCN